MSFTEPDPSVARRVLREIGQGFLGESRAAIAVREQIADFLARHATQDPPPPILLRGEAGVGKSLLARLIHQAGPRRDGPFVDFDCSAIPESLFEAWLVGIAPGAFCEARPGAFQGANHGTIFLDHVAELSHGSQTRLLWALEKVLAQRSVYRVGSTRNDPEPADVWILTSTRDDLRVAIHEGHFREDLYQRLGELDLLIPPLRQRVDILFLAEHFLARLCAEHSWPPKVFAPDARSALLAYPWPGNVREVKALTERVALRFAKKNIITAAMLALRKWNEPAGRPRRIRR